MNFIEVIIDALIEWGRNMLFDASGRRMEDFIVRKITELRRRKTDPARGRRHERRKRRKRR
jgi:hypothetical protein